MSSFGGMTRKSCLGARPLRCALLDRTSGRLAGGGERSWPELSAAAVAASLERPLSEVEDCFVRLARREQFLGAAGVATWPDGTTALRFRLHHTLYVDVLYD